MTAKIIKSTSRGQITLPIDWRNQFKTDSFIMEIGEDKIVVKPFIINNDETIFDSERDNKSKGIPVDDMIKMLKKLQNE
jgi:bifunctional DNA-binding transcriptional regulator/antitoxin component of YhaV-PrlF toxin-antitoxin module